MRRLTSRPRKAKPCTEINLIQFVRLWTKLILVCSNLILRGKFKMENKKKYLNNYMISYIIAKRMRS
ncbi:hypothetical protein COC52_06035 [Priestia megaterium]|nr:hypothetical protein [Priestia aryabhattai]PFP04588.1 hypothetical protein COJ90_28375 [Priestia megaterium]PGR30984.1 hypothetical protein COC52_06035 [Priestia megaterium]